MLDPAVDALGEQAATNGARAAMIVGRPVVALVNAAPDRVLEAIATQVQGLVVGAKAYFAPVPIEHRSDSIA
jgi:hypothetical protein